MTPTSATDRRWNSQSVATLFILFSAGLVCALMSLFTPLQFDDLQFIAEYRLHTPDGSDTFSFKAWADYIVAVRNNDNARIGNLISPVLSLFSPWKQLFPWATGALYALSIALTMHLIRRKGAAWAAVIWALTVVFLPWRNQIFVHAYSLNYILSLAASLLAIVLSLNTLQTKRRFGWALAAVILAGWTHEGFAVPTVAGMAVVLIARGFRPGWRWWVLTAVYGAVALAAFLCPGMIDRAGRQLGNDPVPTSFILRMANLFLVVVAIGVTLAEIILFDRQKRCELLKSPVFQLFFTAMIAASFISLITPGAGRTAFWPEMCAIVLLSGPLCRMTIKPQLRLITALTLWILCSAQGAGAIIWQHKILIQNREIMSMLADGPKTVFYDTIDPDDVPFTTLKYPTRVLWIDEFQYEALENYLGGPGTAVVPTSLRRAGSDAGTPLSGNLGARRLGDAIWIDNTDDFPATVDVTLADGSSRSAITFCIKFANEKGDSLVYLKPLKIAAGDITSISR